jgi:hypothetical protein
VLSVEDWAEIRRLGRAEQLPIKQIARVLGVSKNTVKRALAADGPPRYVAGSARVDRGPGRAQDPGAAADVADDAGHRDRRADRLDPLADGAQGPGAGAPAYLPADPASRTLYAYAAGEVAQCDLWFPAITLSGLLEVLHVTVGQPR